ncbi:MAG TPA: hypothetical protein VFY14_15145 [Streptomyces sp.]|nr:hypothetical protein [Streptomyces sp.]
MTARAANCVRCGEHTATPVLVHVVESGSGPGALIYACPTHAWAEILNHTTSCADCHALGGRCDVARDMWQDLRAAREAADD